MNRKKLIGIIIAAVLVVALAVVAVLFATGTLSGISPFDTKWGIELGS